MNARPHFIEALSYLRLLSLLFERSRLRSRDKLRDFLRFRSRLRDLFSLRPSIDLDLLREGLFLIRSLDRLLLPREIDRLRRFFIPREPLRLRRSRERERRLRSRDLKLRNFHLAMD